MNTESNSETVSPDAAEQDQSRRATRKRNAEQIGRRLRMIRLSRDVSQGDLAEGIEFSRAHVNAVENDKSSPSFEFINNCAKFFDISLDEFTKPLPTVDPETKQRFRDRLAAISPYLREVDYEAMLETLEASYIAAQEEIKHTKNI